MTRVGRCNFFLGATMYPAWKRREFCYTSGMDRKQNKYDLGFLQKTDFEFII